MTAARCRKRKRLIGLKSYTASVYRGELGGRRGTGQACPRWCCERPDGQLVPHGPPRVPRASSLLPRMTRPPECTLGHRGRFAAPAPTPQRGVRGRVRPVAPSAAPSLVHMPIPVHDARRLRSRPPTPGIGAGGHCPAPLTAVRAACSPVSGRPSEGDWLHAIGNSLPRGDHAWLPCDRDDDAERDRQHARTPAHPRSATTSTLLAKVGIVRLTGRTQRRGASVHHYQLADRERVASISVGRACRTARNRLRARERQRRRHRHARPRSPRRAPRAHRRTTSLG